MGIAAASANSKPRRTLSVRFFGDDVIWLYVDEATGHLMAFNAEAGETVTWIAGSTVQIAASGTGSTATIQGGGANDTMIGALQTGAAVLTADAHFGHIPDLRVMNRLE